MAAARFIHSASLMLLVMAIMPAVVVKGEGENQVHIQLTNRPEEMLVWWVTLEEVDSVVEYRLASSPSERWTQATNSTRPRRYTHTDDLHGQYTSGWMHEVILPDLILSRQTYLYRVKIDGGNDWSKNYWFVTRSGRPDARVRLAVLGDQDLPTTLEGRASEDGRAALPVMETLMERFSDFETILHVGGLTYAGGDQEKWDAYGRWMEPLASTKPIQFAVGSNEKEASNSPAVELTYGDNGGLRCVGTYPAWEERWRNGEGRPLPRGNSTAALFWYSFDYGPAHVVVISSEHESSEMFRWLESDLRLADRPENRLLRPWVFVMMYRPMYNPMTGENAPNPRFVARVEPLLRWYRVQLVFSGYCNNYERTYPLYNKVVTNWSRGTTSDPYITRAFDPSDGTNNTSSPIYLTLGIGGRRGDRCDTHEWTVGETKKVYGFGLLEITRTKLYFEVVDVADRFVDSFMMCSKPGCVEAPDVPKLTERELQSKKPSEFSDTSNKSPATTPPTQDEGTVKNLTRAYQTLTERALAASHDSNWHSEISNVLMDNYWVLILVAVALLSVVVFIIVACSVCFGTFGNSSSSTSKSDRRRGNYDENPEEGDSGNSRDLLLLENAPSSARAPTSRRVSGRGKWTSDDIDASQLEMLSAGCNVVSHALTVLDLESTPVSINVSPLPTPAPQRSRGMYSLGVTHGEIASSNKRPSRGV